MRISSVFARYIAQQFTLWFIYLLLGFSGVIMLFDTVELLRRAAGKPEATVAIVMEMSLFKLPDTGEKIFPFVVLFAAMYTFWRMTRSQELVVARASGVSAWQFLTPVLAVAAIIGFMNITLFNPAAAHMVAHYEKMESHYLRLQQGTMDVAGGGIWLRQIMGDDQAVIHAENFDSNTVELTPVIILMFQGADTYVGRIDAQSAKLQNGHWELRDSWMNLPNKPAVFEPERDLPTDLTLKKIEESFAAPETLSFWELPGFIAHMEAAGFSARKHRLHYQSLLAQPGLLCAMVLLAASFSLRQTRRGGTLIMVTGGVLTGLLVFVLSDVVLAIGNTESLPVSLAAWTPAGVSLLLGITAILHLEDG